MTTLRRGVEVIAAVDHARRHADGGDVGRQIAHDGGAGADDRPLPDRDLVDDRRAGPDVAAVAEARVPGHGRARVQVHEVTDDRVVRDRRVHVEDDVRADAHTRGDDAPRAPGTCPDRASRPARRGPPGAAASARCPARPARFDPLGQALARGVVANGDDAPEPWLGARQALEHRQVPDASRPVRSARPASRRRGIPGAASRRRPGARRPRRSTLPPRGRRRR